MIRRAAAGLGLLAALLWPGTGAAESCPDRADPLGWAAPDFVKAQSGGYLGLATVGVGYATKNDLLAVAAYYGWVPRQVAGIEIHSFAVTLTARGRLCLDSRWEWIVAYGGVGSVFTRGEGFFIESPSPYPDDYYQPTARRYLVLVGSEVLLKPTTAPAWLSGHGPFFEVVFLDKYLSAWWKNDRIALRETLSLALGYKLRM
ncbi:MAG: hypothetical protein IT377_31800 [Polyangiaceae bacterium]|nr:hypothetical protein [Polyangiaceae bacterium]